MSGIRSSSRNPYLDDGDEEVDDFAFVAHPTQGSSGYVLGNGRYGGGGGGGAGNNVDYVQKRQQLLDERRLIEERTLQSSKMSLGLVYESEKVGVSTAEELLRQREKLNNVDNSLDSMNSTMRVTQKHLTSMKSWLGGVKNIFSKPPEPNMSIPSSQSTPGIGARPSNFGSSRLGETVEAVSNESNGRNSENHLAFARRGIDTSGFRFDDDEDDGSSKPRKGGADGYAQRSAAIDKQLSTNLSELDMGLGRLKSLALGLGQEIEQQNDMIEHITTKAERSEDSLQYQNRQMRHILKK